jgi:hypothetical protein
VVCPCTASLSLGADYDRCDVVLVFHVDTGQIEGIDVGGLTLALVADTPKFMHEGNWRVGVLVDDAASDEQAEKLGAVFGGELGGPVAALVPLIGELMGVQRVPMQFSSEGGRHSLRMGDAGELEVEDIVPFGVESGQPARLSGIFHPVGDELAIAKSSGSRLKIFGLQPDLAGKAAFSASFAWSA